MSIPKAYALSSYSYELPTELIAQHPPAARRDSRLLAMAADGVIDDTGFADLSERLRPGDLLVVNNTRVIPARLVGTKSTGGRVEVFLERITGSDTALVQIRASRAPATGQQLTVAGVELEVHGREGRFFSIQRVDGEDLLDHFIEHGEVPLPPYIDRSAEGEDAARYQTVYAERDGAVAAPTAGLHFDEEMLGQLQALGVERANITLHVGAGTFHPVKVDDIRAHDMHGEWIDVSQALADQIAQTRARAGRVIAVGTTVVRALESAAKATGQVQAFRGETSLFIGPGHQFRAVDMLITNFHLPASTLLVLVSAFAGYDRVMNAYRHAVSERYRFFSYGDAMLLQHSPDSTAANA